MTEKKDGRAYNAEVLAILAEMKPKLEDAGMQAKIDELTERAERQAKKLFLKTQGGTELAQKAAGLASTLKAKVAESAPAAQIKQAFDELVESFEFFIYRAETLIIRMT